MSASGILHHRSQRWPGLAAASLLMVLGCAPDDSSASETTVSNATVTTTTTTTTEAIELPETTVPEPGPERLETIRLAAPPDCASNPYCADGLARVYGIEVRESLIPTESGAPIADAVRAGTADVGVLFSDDPELESADLVVLSDDRGMVASDSVVVVAPGAVLEVWGPQLGAVINEISASLTEPALRKALRSVRNGAAPAEAAAVLFATIVDGRGDEISDGVPIRVGAKAFTTDQVLANVYVLGLEDRGIAAEVVELDGFRALQVAALIDGEIDLAVDYTASLLEFLNGFSGAASADPVETYDALTELIGLADYVAFDPAPVQSRNVFVMRADVAAANGIETVSDLAGFAPAAEVSAPPGQLPDLADPFAIFSPDDLRIGSEGPAVRELQELLASIGYDPGPRNGLYEEPTRRAVAAFQVDLGAGPDGIVGPVTLQALREAVEAGAQAETESLTDSGADSGLELHLSFDDGPNANYTPRILDLLARYDARAVFFTIGSQVDSGADILRRMVADGHRIGNHTWGHPSLDGISAGAFADEIGRTQEAIERVTGQRPSCLRPPYGATDSTTADKAASFGLSIELWNVDPQDWAAPGTDSIVSNIVQHARAGDVILMHDGGGTREQTVAALERVLEHFSAEGYRFTPIPGC